jgi:hypothetical protein
VGAAGLVAARGRGDPGDPVGIGLVERLVLEPRVGERIQAPPGRAAAVEVTR